MLVATPGRLLDLVEKGHVDLSKVEILVLDEADRMLDMGFWPDVKRIMALLPEKRQNLLFSATALPDVERVAGPVLHNPARIEVAPSATPIEAITQSLYPVNGLQKTELLVPVPGKARDLRSGFWSSPRPAPRRQSVRQLEPARLPGAAHRRTSTRPASTGAGLSRTARTVCWWPPTSWPAASTWTVSRT